MEKRAKSNRLGGVPSGRGQHSDRKQTLSACNGLDVQYKPIPGASVHDSRCTIVVNVRLHYSTFLNYRDSKLARLSLSITKKTRSSITSK